MNNKEELKNIKKNIEHIADNVKKPITEDIENIKKSSNIKVKWYHKLIAYSLYCLGVPLLLLIIYELFLTKFISYNINYLDFVGLNLFIKLLFWKIK